MNASVIRRVGTAHRFRLPAFTEMVGNAHPTKLAVGRRGIIPAEWAKPGAIVIDVAMNRNEAGKLVGDIDFEAARERVGWITPVA